MEGSMRRIGIPLLAVVAGVGLGWAARSALTHGAGSDRRSDSSMAAADPGVPIACNLDALSAQERERHAALLLELGGKVLEMRELPDGYAYRFAPEARTVAEIAEWIGLERACCPFLRFSLDVEPNTGPVWLRLTGSARVKEFIGATFRPSRG